MSKTGTLDSQQQTQPRVMRPLGNMERSAWIFDQASPFRIGSAVDFRGQVTEAGLREVLRWCQRRYPLLRSVLHLERGRPHFACFEPDVAPEIPLETGSGGLDDRDRISTEELRKPFGGEGELMIRVKLVRFSEDHCSVFVTFRHLIGDGASAANLLMDIIRLLGALSVGEALPPAEPLPFPPTMEDGVASKFKGFGGLLKMVGCQSKVTQRMKDLGGMPSPLRHDTETSFAERVPTVETISFDPTETASLIERAKRENVTLYALLAAITLDAVFPFLAENEKNKEGSDHFVTMPVPTNLRPFLSVSDGTEFGFFSSTMDVVYPLTDRNDIPQMAREIRSEIKSSTKKDSARLYVMPTIASIMNWRLFFPNKTKGIDRAARFIASMAKHSSTSLTFLNFPRLSKESGGLEVTSARGYLAPSMLGTALFSAVLFGETLNVHLSYNEKQFNREDASRLKARFKETALSAATTAEVPGDG